LFKLVSLHLHSINSVVTIIVAILAILAIRNQITHAKERAFQDFSAASLLVIPRAKSLAKPPGLSPG
jgi:hypothetical protein